MNLNKLIVIFSIFLLAGLHVFSQSYPWERPLKIAWSNDGKNFGSSTIFQDSSGVPSVIRWKGDTLICAFQWFRIPMNSPSWDRVAVKFSYDNGITWTQPTPILVKDLPANYQRPFDPTLAVFGTDSIRIYFSSSTIPKMGLDSIVNTYSAKSVEGINYTFEPGARVDEPTNRVIDPAIIFFKTGWHYTAPIGSPQQGAYHYVSPDGIHFSPVPIIPSDNQHNWTGNLMVNDTNEIRFYGSGSYIWYKSSSNGGTWNDFINTNVKGGDPSVLKIVDNNYLIIFVGNPYPVSVDNKVNVENNFLLYPNPVNNSFEIYNGRQDSDYEYRIFSSQWQILKTGKSTKNPIDISCIPSGIYFLALQSNNENHKQALLKFVKE